MTSNQSSSTAQTISFLSYMQEGGSGQESHADTATMTKANAETHPMQEDNTHLGVTEKQEEGGTFFHVAAIIAVAVFLVVMGVVLVRVFKGLGGDGH